jgi:hypothetical protein
MSENISKAKSFIAQLRKEREGYSKDTLARITKIYTGDNRKRPKPGFFRESSFLYIRSYHSDIGVRPFSGITFWNSPDINISPLNNIGSYTTLLEGGKSYNIQCRLHNRGDLMIPNPKVEFFLTDPTLGFNTTIAKYLGVTQMQALLLPASNGEANIVYNVPASEAGHKCMFARTWSFSPVDKPFDLFSLDPRIDRHIAQKNLNFVPQAVPYMFNLVHQPNAFETIAFQPLSKDAVMALQHPALRDLRITSITNKELLGKIKIELADKSESRFIMEPANGQWQIKSSARKGLDINKQAALMKETEAIIQSVYSGRTSFREHKKTLEAFEDMNKNVMQTALKINIPNLGLKKGIAAGFDIVNVNQINGQIKGGITIVAMGG